MRPCPCARLQARDEDNVVALDAQEAWVEMEVDDGQVLRAARKHHRSLERAKGWQGAAARTLKAIFPDAGKHA